MRLDRRRFLLGAAAVACVGCSDGGDEQDGGAGPAAPPADPGSFGGDVDAGTVDEVRAALAETGAPLYLPEARAYLVVDDGAADGLAALYQRCTHLGCRVPWCESSKRFECPCHGGVFNRIGELVEGPPPRGLDRFEVRIDAGRVVLDTSVPVEGPAQGVLTVDGAPAGPACVVPPNP